MRGGAGGVFVCMTVWECLSLACGNLFVMEFERFVKKLVRVMCICIKQSPPHREHM